MWGSRKHCRWCGIEYYAAKPVDRNGFCCKAHKQALYRARKKSVTAKAHSAGPGYRTAVTRKKKIRKKNIDKKRKRS